MSFFKVSPLLVQPLKVCVTHLCRASLPEPAYDQLVDPARIFQVKPLEFDPAKTDLVRATWLDGTECPSGSLDATRRRGSLPGTDRARRTGPPFLVSIRRVA